MRRNGFNGTFNYVFKVKPSIADKVAFKALKIAGMEVGNHTLFHVKFPYYSPLFNGQDPKNMEGGQLPFPSNEELKDDRGDGKNVFGKIIDEAVSFQSGFSIKKKWSELTDEECQLIRDFFSVYKNRRIAKALDVLSNKYLGTSGRSYKSYNGYEYTGGIFTGCKTSENHEIWERIIEIQKLYAKDYFGIQMTVWSMPGSDNANLYFENKGKYYYDRLLQKPANDSSVFYSSFKQQNRSWTDVLSQNGYVVKHDSMYRGRADGECSTESKHILFYNKQFHRSVLEYPIERSVCYKWNFCCEKINNNKDILKTPKDLFDGKENGINEYYQTVESIRKGIAQGLICGSVWDSSMMWGERFFWESLVEFCKKNSIQIISETEAYIKSLGNSFTANTNLILNSMYHNSLDIFESSLQAYNPDGFSGDCISVDEEDAYNRVMRVDGTAEYKVYGIVNGDYEYSVSGFGSGEISIYLIKDNDLLDCSSNNIICNMLLQSESKSLYRNLFHVESKNAFGLLIKYIGHFTLGIQNLRMVS